MLTVDMRRSVESDSGYGGVIVLEHFLEGF